MEELTQYVLDNMPEVYKHLKYFRLPILVEGRLVWFKYNRGEVDITEKAPAKFKPVVVYNREGKEPQQKETNKKKSKKELDEDDFDTMTMLQEDEEEEDDWEDPRAKRLRERKEKKNKGKSRRESLNEQELETEDLPNKFEDNLEDEEEYNEPKKGVGALIFVIILMLTLIGGIVWLFFLGGMDKLKGNSEPVEQPAIEQDVNTNTTVQTTLDLTSEPAPPDIVEDYDVIDDGTPMIDDNTSMIEDAEPTIADSAVDPSMDNLVEDKSVIVLYNEDLTEADWSEDFNYNIGDYYSDDTGKYFIASEVVNINVPEDRVGQSLKVSIPLKANVDNNVSEVLQNTEYVIKAFDGATAENVVSMNTEYTSTFKLAESGKVSYALVGIIPKDVEVGSADDWKNFQMIISR